MPRDESLLKIHFQYVSVLFNTFQYFQSAYRMYRKISTSIFLFSFSLYLFIYLSNGIEKTFHCFSILFNISSVIDPWKVQHSRSINQCENTIYLYSLWDQKIFELSRQANLLGRDAQGQNQNQQNVVSFTFNLKRNLKSIFDQAEI